MQGLKKGKYDSSKNLATVKENPDEKDTEITCHEVKVQESKLSHNFQKKLSDRKTMNGHSTTSGSS